ncbi:hypothetical protein [Okeania sp. SIO2C9]|uniref:hypothetical protein n=1 Tax=Okeania sp. SIO2C9 TaxID=2607791 RepID=UPI0025FD8FAE|nr:hypothetical protein [Okeania sp. SIO2C9]
MILAEKYYCLGVTELIYAHGQVHPQTLRRWQRLAVKTCIYNFFHVSNHIFGQNFFPVFGHETYMQVNIINYMSTFIKLFLHNFYLRADFPHANMLI